MVRPAEVKVKTQPAVEVVLEGWCPIGIPKPREREGVSAMLTAIDVVSQAMLQDSVRRRYLFLNRGRLKVSKQVEEEMRNLQRETPAGQG